MKVYLIVLSLFSFFIFCLQAGVKKSTIIISGGGGGGGQCNCPPLWPMLQLLMKLPQQKSKHHHPKQYSDFREDYSTIALS